MPREHHPAPPSDMQVASSSSVVKAEHPQILGDVSEPAALSRRREALRRHVEKRVLSGFNIKNSLDSSELAEIKESIANLAPKEKMEALYGEILAYDDTMRALMADIPASPERKTRISDSRQDIDPALLARLSLLWSDETVRESFLSRYAESRESDRQVRLSALGQEYSRLSRDRNRVAADFIAIERDLFTGSIKRPDRVRSARKQAEQLVARKQRIEHLLHSISTLENRPATEANTDLAAMVMFETISRYRNELEEGFVWLPYFDDLLQKAVEGLQNGRWPLLVGESGTGKSEVAEAAIRRLSNSDPVLVDCTPRVNEMDLVKRQEGSGVYTYGKLMAAATGYERSDQEKPAHPAGRIVRFDEMLRLGTFAFAALKRARQLKPGGVYEDGKKVLPGFGGIGTSNPPGRRYGPEVKPLDAALEREFAVLQSDYPPMKNDDPQLYEFLLASLLDEHKHTDVHPYELAPHYIFDESEKGTSLKETVTNPNTNTPEEKTIGVIAGREKLAEDPTDSRHGILWRFAHAVRAVQDAYTLGNAKPTDPVPPEAFRCNISPDGAIIFNPAGSEILRLERATMTLEIKSWMEGWRARKQKDSPAANVVTLAEWIQYKLKQYIASLSDDSDREKIQALCSHFHLFDAVSPVLEQTKPLTPLMIGKLSPRVPRPYQLQESSAPSLEPVKAGPETKPITNYSTEVVVMEDWSQIELSRDPSVGFDFIKDGKAIHIRTGSLFTLQGERLVLAGKVKQQGHPADGELLVKLSGEALHRVIKQEDIEERAEEFEIVLVVADALNPYDKALREAGVTAGDEINERREMTVNISEIIRQQAKTYRDLAGNEGVPELEKWASDIENRAHLIEEEINKDHAKVIERIKAGMIPIVMPSQSVQMNTWQKALAKLKPLWMTCREPEPGKKESVDEKLNDAWLYDKYAAEKMDKAGFFKNIPNRPYLVWTKPAQKSDACGKTFVAQQKHYAAMVKATPNLCDSTDLIPTEYAALQAVFTRQVQDRHKQSQGETAVPDAIRPLDYYGDDFSFTRFLSAGAFSGGLVPGAFFSPGSGGRRVDFGSDDSGAYGWGGFRPAARS